MCDRDGSNPTAAAHTRFGSEIVANNICPKSCEPDGSELLLCGSISFVYDLWGGLKEQGIFEEKRYTEIFFSHLRTFKLTPSSSASSLGGNLKY